MTVISHEHTNNVCILVIDASLTDRFAKNVNAQLHTRVIDSAKKFFTQSLSIENPLLPAVVGFFRRTDFCLVGQVPTKPKER